MFFVKQQTNWREKNLKGKVKEIKENFVSVSKKSNNEIVNEGDSFDGNKKIFRFNAFGNLIEDTSDYTYKYDEQNMLSEYEYRDYGLNKCYYDFDLKLIEVHDFNSKGKLTDKFKFKYNSEGKIECEEKSDDRGIVYRKLYYYVTNNSTRIETRAGNGTKTSEILIEYDENGNIIKEEKVGAFNRGTVTTYQYNEHKDITVKDNYTYYKYHYDEKGNWIKKIEHRKQWLLQRIFNLSFRRLIPTNITTREITYYQN